MKKFNILIVDDNSNNIVVLTELLKVIKDIRLITSRSGREALEVVLRERIDLMLLDIQLPDINGYEVARMVKGKKNTMNIPIVFVTAIYQSDLNVRRGYQIGAVDYLIKPINRDELISKVNFYMNQAKVKKELIDRLVVSRNELQFRNEELEKLRIELLESRNNWRYLGENIPDKVFVINTDLEIEFSNTVDFMVQGILAEDDIIESAKQAFKDKHSLTKRLSFDDEWFEVSSIFQDEDEHSKVMVIVRDISERVNSQKRIEYLGYNDLLTGLRNRHYFADFRTDILKEGKYPIAIIVGDVEGLKLINDVFGHDYGDELLRQSAEIFMAIEQDEKVCIRWGGDEFVVLISNIDEDELASVIDDLHQQFAKIKIDDFIKYGISLGYSLLYDNEKSFFDGFKEAEDRMYLNKLNHRNRRKSNIVYTLHSTMMQKNYETAEHTQRMIQQGLAFAEYLSLKQHEIDSLQALLTLHDIGKVSIDKRILEKPNSLNEVEWDQIKKHSEIGYRLCSTIPEISSNANAILSHHEWWDGTGYPQGLKYEEIPYLARIISLIDAYDVMTHERVYKNKICEKDAFEEIANGAGTQFDPDLANKFLDFLKQHK